MESQRRLAMANCQFARLQEPNVATLYSSKKQKNDEDQNHEAEAAARVVSPAGAVGPCRQSAERNQEQNHNEYGNHVCIRPLSRSVQRSGLGLSTSARALDIRRVTATIRVFV